MRWIKYGIFVSILTALSCETNPYRQGERLYNLYCANCHMEDGNGLMSLYPPLNTAAFQGYSSEFACIIRNGLSDTLRIDNKDFVFPMPENRELNNVAISNIYNYIIYKWHPDLKPTTANEVQEKLDNCP